MLKVAPWTNAPKVSSPNFFRLDGLLLFCITMGLGCARCELRYKDDGKRQFSRKRSSVADTLVSLAQLKYILLDSNDLPSLWRERIALAHLPCTVFWSPCLGYYNLHSVSFFSKNARLFHHLSSSMSAETLNPLFSRSAGFCLVGTCLRCSGLVNDWISPRRFATKGLNFLLRPWTH